MTCLICNVSPKTYLAGWDYILNCLLTLLAIILNAKEINILRKRKEKKPYEKMLLSLSCCDLSYQLADSVFLPMVAYAVVKKDYNLSSTLWLTWGSTSFLVAMISLLHLIFISIDRAWAVTAPFHHLSVVDGRKVVVAISVAWTLPLLVVLLFTIHIVLHESSTGMINYITNRAPTKVLATLMLVTNIAFLISNTTTLWIVFKSKSAQTSSIAMTFQEKDGPLSQQMHCLIICVGTVLCFVVSSTPLIISRLITWDTPLWLEALGYTMFSLNSVLNSAIFLTQNYRHKRSKALKSRRSTNQELIVENQRSKATV